ncbi:hypothetical protein [Teichococcus vastitatis]|uniref:Uncharacterized protein n=1 Tax=Teichococcus vastitatis TaxID=2307076 RepID=A0ABS9W0W4_9PROT|nr:hypothetical protein [Pseudoroseomonas vastitatis]MCI0752945.1 hypothetical protein [Pseudoroseomonas vastitatis]
MSWSRRSQTELLARRYLASRGGTPMVRDPLTLAVPQLQREVEQVGRLARLDLSMAAALLLSAVAVTLTAWLAPLHGSVLTMMLYLHLVPLFALGVCIWAAIVVEQSGPRWMLARRIGHALRAGALMEALELALRGLPPQRPAA